MSHVRSRKEFADTVEPGKVTGARPDARPDPRPDSPAKPSLLLRLPQLPAAQKGVRVVRAHDNADLFDAEAALAAARAETKRLKVDISSATEQGREEGYAAGREQANAELAGEIHRVQQFMAQWQAEARETIIDLGVKIATRIVGTVDIDETTRQTIVTQTLKHVNDAPYTLQVASDMLPTARRAMQQIAEEHADVALPTLRLDARLPDGRAILVTRFGSIDLDLHAQIEAIRMSLLGRGDAEQQAYTHA